MIRGILFDMDGVLFDTEALCARADEAVAAQMGYTFSRELHCAITGLAAPDVRRVICEAMGPDFDYEQFITRTRAAVQADIDANGLPKKPGVDVALDWLRQQEYPMALASSSRIETVRAHLRRAGLEGYFKALVGGDMVAQGKPAPDIFLAAADALGLDPRYCIAVEDSFNGVRSAAAAGCITIMVPDMQAPTAEIRALCADVLCGLDKLPRVVNYYNCR